MPRSRKAISTAMKIPQNTNVDLSVHRIRRKVKMNHPCFISWGLNWESVWEWEWA